MATIDVSTGMTLEYDIRGEGEPILFVMGLAGQLIDWPEDFVDLFADEGFMTIRYDNRDIGLSTQTDWEPPTQQKVLGAMLRRRPVKDVGYTVEDMAADGAALLEALGIESAHIVGMSMGGMITQAMAINHPSKV
ncbi:MAG: alpha/beta hydrolase, partial [Actinomycetota bacterium]